MTSVGFYFKGLDREETNALRQRLNDLARAFGYYSESAAGRKANEGVISSLLVGLDRGEIVLVRLEPNERNALSKLARSQVEPLFAPVSRALQTAFEALLEGNENSPPPAQDTEDLE